MGKNVSDVIGAWVKRVGKKVSDVIGIWVKGLVTSSEYG